MMLATSTPFDLQVDRFLTDALRAVSANGWIPACNVYEDEQGFCVQMAIPGMEAKDVAIMAEDGVLSIQLPKREEAKPRRITIQG